MRSSAGEQRLPPLFALRAEQAIDARQRFVLATDRGESRAAIIMAHLGDAPVGAVDHLPAHRLALGAVAVQQTVIGLAGEHQGQLPRQIVAVLNRGIAPQTVGGRMAVGGIAGEEQPRLRGSRLRPRG